MSLHRPLVGALVAVALSSLFITSCAGSGVSPKHSDVRYVALGDSVVAGAGIVRSAGVCQRSDHNYPSVLAKELGIGVMVDRSCPGATTVDVLKDLHRSDGVLIPAQIDAVTPGTKVVTISIGANDESLVPAFFACFVPVHNASNACQTALAEIPAVLARTRTSIANVLNQIKTRAPKSLIVLVSYLRLMPDSGSCPYVPISPADVPAAAAAEGALETTMRAAADDAGVTYLSMRSMSVGHDACAKPGDAWVNGVKPAPGDGTQLHPNALGMRAVADALKPIVADRLGK